MLGEERGLHAALHIVQIHPLILQKKKKRNPFISSFQCYKTLIVGHAKGIRMLLQLAFISSFGGFLRVISFPADSACV